MDNIERFVEEQCWQLKDGTNVIFKLLQQYMNFRVASYFEGFKVFCEKFIQLQATSSWNLAREIHGVQHITANTILTAVTYNENALTLGLNAYFEETVKELTLVQLEKLLIFWTGSSHLLEKVC